MHDLIDIIWFHTWWQYEPDGDSLYSAPYHWFNIAEAIAWFIFTLLVLWRWNRQRQSLIEIAYASAFLLFGITDLLESQALTSWLIWLKLVNLIALVWLRAIVIRRFYPQSKLY